MITPQTLMRKHIVPMIETVAVAVGDNNVIVITIAVMFPINNISSNKRSQLLYTESTAVVTEYRCARITIPHYLIFGLVSNANIRYRGKRPRSSTPLQKRYLSLNGAW